MTLSGWNSETELPSGAYDALPELFDKFLRGGVTDDGVGGSKTWTYVPVDPYTIWDDEPEPERASHTRLAVFLVAAALVAVLLLRRLR